MRKYKIPNQKSIYIERQTWNSDATVAFHNHDCTEIVYVIDGSGINYIDCFRYPVIAGDLYFINMESKHSSYSASGMTIYNLMFKFDDTFSSDEMSSFLENEYFSAFFSYGKKLQLNREKTLSRIHLPPPNAEHIKRWFDLLYLEQGNRLPGQYYNMKALLTLILNAVCRDYSSLKERACLIEESRNESLQAFPRIMDYINKNYTKNVSLSRLANLMNLTSNYLSELFRKQAGIGIMRYVLSLRIESARIMLLEAPRLNITEIALRSGFHDPNYFTRAFRKATNYSPLEYRKKFLPNRRKC